MKNYVHANGRHIGAYADITARNDISLGKIPGNYLDCASTSNYIGAIVVPNMFTHTQDNHVLVGTATSSDI